MGTSSQDPWGLGPPPPANYGVSQFALEGPSQLDEGRQWASSSRTSYPSHHDSSYPAYHDAQRETPRLYEQMPTVQSAPAAFPPRLPTLSDAGLGMYRDTSPFTQGSSTGPSEFASSPRSNSSRSSPPQSTPTPSPGRRPRSDLDLVPLDYLQNLQPPARHPWDEALLQSLAAVRVTPPRFART